MCFGLSFAGMFLLVLFSFFFCNGFFGLFGSGFFCFFGSRLIFRFRQVFGLIYRWQAGYRRGGLNRG